jgi:hypothetical protein
MTNPKTDGCVQFQISVNVDIAEIARWEPGRIAAFFNGVAKIVAANGASDGDEQPAGELLADERPELDEQDSPKGIGRPKDADKEAAVFELLDQGVAVSEIARRLGIHRNSVYCIKKRWHPGDSSPDDESEELDDATDVEDEQGGEENPDWAEPDIRDDDGTPCGSEVKPKVVDALGNYPDGLGVDAIVDLTGLAKKRVQACLVNHRHKSFARDETGIWTLLETASASVGKPSVTPLEGKSNWGNMVATLLKSDQPLELKEIASITRIPQADLFKILADETLFERDTDQLYWLAK